MNYDLIVIGSGPGGYVAAIRASQLGMKVGVVEKAELGGVCLNWGCIPTKALLKSAEVYHNFNKAKEYGISVEGEIKPDFEAMVSRSRKVADGMSRGVQYLFKKNQIDHIRGTGKLVDKKTVEVSDTDGNTANYSANHIILATGARSKELPNLKQDGEKVIGYRKAMTLPKQPKSIIVVGSGAIGSEFADFYNSIGTEVTLVEVLPSVVPIEDQEVSKQLARSFKKKGIKVMTNASIESVDTTGDLCKATIKTKKGEETKEAEIVLSAVGITPNLENLGVEEMGIEMDNGKVKVDEFYRTNMEGVYAIGDIVQGPALAHVASAEGIACVEKIAGKNPEPLDYRNLPSCTYTSPEIASVGMTEEAAKEAGYEIKVGKFPFTASGKANAGGESEGFVKLIFDAQYGELLGAHMIGAHVTEMIGELLVGKKIEATGHEFIKSVHPHPTMSEAIMEAAAAAYDEVIHI
ncbi:MAG: dihydrolipoyl dehydrogenase [Bacteroidales bacterium]|nr:dihydrolipoyl dehydrogenase [Bacteroidales bacterium]MBS3773931.1 dihydrolipoyl dehydrogenase [Bacteroidales bacterium]